MPTTTLETVRVELDRWRGTREKSGRAPNRIMLVLIGGLPLINSMPQHVCFN